MSLEIRLTEEEAQAAYKGINMATQTQFIHQCECMGGPTCLLSRSGYAHKGKQCDTRTAAKYCFGCSQEEPELVDKRREPMPRPKKFEAATTPVSLVPLQEQGPGVAPQKGAQPLGESAFPLSHLTMWGTGNTIDALTALPLNPAGSPVLTRETGHWILDCDGGSNPTYYTDKAAAIARAKLLLNPDTMDSIGIYKLIDVVEFEPRLRTRHIPQRKVKGNP